MVFSLAALALYVVCALGLLLAVGRWVLPVSRRTAAILILLPLCFTGRAFLTGRIYAPADVLYATPPFGSVAANHGFEPPYNMFLADVVTMVIPWRKAVQVAVANGEWPLWNPYMFGGDPLAASATPAAYHPVTLLSLLLPIGWSLTWSAAAIFFLAGTGAFLFVRDLGCREEAALVGAAGWMYCGFLVLWNQMPQGASATLLPWVYLGVRRCCRDPAPRSLGLLIAAFSVLLFAGHPESAAHVVFLGLLYAAYEMAVARREQRLAAVAGGLGAGVLALAVCAVYLLPFLDAIFQTVEYGFRSSLFAHQERSVEAAEALRRLLPNLVPFSYGIAGRETIAGPEWFLPPSSAYCGSLLLAPAALGLGWSRWRGRWVIAGIGLLGVLAGASAPGVADLLPYVPFLGMAINKRLVFAGGLAVAVLAALGIEEWLRRKDRRFSALQLAVLALLAAAVAVAWPHWRAAGLSAGFLRHQALLLLAPPAVAAVLGLGHWRRSRLALAFLLLLAAQRTLEMGSFCATVEPDTFFPRIAPLNAVAETGAPAIRGGGRFVAFGGLLTPNVATLYGLEDVRGYQAISLERRVETDKLWSNRPWFGPNSVTEDSPFLDFLNVRFAVVGRRQKPPPGWRVIARSRRGRLLENLEALERAFVPRQVRLGGPRRQVLEELGQAEDFGRLSWVSAERLNLPPADRPGPPVTEDNGPGTVEVERHGTRYRLRADMEGPGWVVVSEPAWRGWQARSAGEAIPLRYGNHAYLAFYLPAGRHQVELFFRPRSFAAGLAVSLVTLGALLVWGVVRWRRR